MKHAVKIALAYVGIVIGAGFASGQEVLQYFAAFGWRGIAGASLAAIVIAVTTMIIFQFGSYLLAYEHNQVLEELRFPWLTRILDLSVIITLFSIGFVMFAGAGANLQQQWGAHPWIGAFLMLTLVLVTGMLDVDKVSTVIGAATPFITLLLLVTFGAVLLGPWPSLTELEAGSQLIATTLPNALVSSINYAGLVLICALSMSVVISGNHLNTRATGRGGLIGGVAFGLMLVLSALSLYREAPLVAGDAMPLMTLLNALHPVVGQVMAAIIYLMIFNTAVSLFYALGKRLTTRAPHRFRLVYVLVCLLGFTLSFVGFQTLVGWVYPFLGYAGVLLAVAMFAMWLRQRRQIRLESRRRDAIVELAEKKFDEQVVFSEQEQAVLDRHVERSNVDNDELREAIVEHVSADTSDYDVADWDDVDVTNPAMPAIVIDGDLPQASTSST